MSDNASLLDHARRYFGLAAQSADPRKMKLLAELGLEYLRLAQEETRAAERSAKTTRQE